MNSIGIMFKSYFGSGFFFYIYIIALIYIYIACKEKRKLLVYPAIVITIFVLNPISWKFLAKLMAGGTYWRLVWTLPMVIVIGYVITDIIRRVKPMGLKLVISIVMAGIIVFGGSYMYDGTTFFQSDNYYKLPQSTINLANVLLQNSEEPYAIVPATQYCYIRQYSAKIHLMYGRDADGFVAGNLMSDDAIAVRDELRKDTPDLKVVSEVALRNGYEFIVVEGWQHINQEEFKEYGFAYIMSIDGYAVYQVANKIR